MTRLGRAGSPPHAEGTRGTESRRRSIGAARKPAQSHSVAPSGPQRPDEQGRENAGCGGSLRGGGTGSGEPLSAVAGLAPLFLGEAHREPRTGGFLGGLLGLPARADVAFGDVQLDKANVVLIPGGWAPDRLRTHASAVALVDRMFESPLYRADRASFLLYPERALPGFLEKNAVPREGVLAVPLLRELLEAEDRSVLSLDADGVFRFHPDFRNARDLAAALDSLG